MQKKKKEGKKKKGGVQCWLVREESINQFFTIKVIRKAFEHKTIFFHY